MFLQKQTYQVDKYKFENIQIKEEISKVLFWFEKVLYRHSKVTKSLKLRRKKNKSVSCHTTIPFHYYTLLNWTWSATLTLRNLIYIYHLSEIGNSLMCFVVHASRAYKRPPFQSRSSLLLRDKLYLWHLNKTYYLYESWLVINNVSTVSAL